MKKIISIILSMLIFCSLLSGTVFTSNSAEISSNTTSTDYYSGDFKYYILYNNTVSIRGYYGNDTNLVIPKKLNGYTVTDISYYPFKNNKNLTSITIPETVDTICGGAFENCTNLKEVHTTNLSAWMKIRFLDAKANPVYYAKKLYVNNELLTELTVPENLNRINDYVFVNCTSLTKVVAPDHVTSVGFGTFTGCSNLTDITLTDNISFIGHNAFDDIGYMNNPDNWNNGLLYISNHLIRGDENAPEDAIIRNGTKTIYDKALSGCKNITSLTIPESIIYIGLNSFKNCTNLETVNYNAIKCTRSGAQFYAPFSGCSRIKKINIGKNVQTIPAFAFSNCTGLTDIEIPESVKSIGSLIFDNCTNLENISIPDSVASIGYNIVYGTKYHNDENNWKNNLLYIDNHLIAAKEYLSGHCEIDKGTLTIAACTFEGFNNLSSVFIPDSVFNIGIGAFDFCNGLNHILYEGSEKKWNSVIIEESNNTISEQGITHFNATKGFITENKPATCADKGFICTKCPYCNIEYNKTVINESGHNIVIDKAVEPDCITPGLTEGNHCSLCNQVFTEQTIVKALGHNYTNKTIISKATCTSEGKIKSSCSRCNDENIEIVSAISHKIVTDKAVKPTCTKTGLTEGAHCSICDKILKKQKVLNAKKHNLKTVSVKKATYFQSGLTHKKCTICKRDIMSGNGKLKLEVPVINVSVSKNKITVKYKKVKDATGFQIRYKKGNKYVIKNYNEKKTTTKVIKNLNEGTYKVQVRAYIKKGNQIACSFWTKTKTLKIN